MRHSIYLPITTDMTVTDVFYNNKYLDILKSKDHSLKINSDKHPVSYNIVDMLLENEKNETPYEKLSKSINNARIISLANVKKQLWKFKYVAKTLCYKGCSACEYLCISVNYLLKKYLQCKLINKTILTISHNNTNLTYYTIEAHGTLFNPNVLYLFNTCKNCTIYCILNIENNNKYKQTVVNKNNNNTYHLLTYNTNGDILNKSTFDTIIKRLNKKVFDCIILYDYFNDTPRYINNIVLAYLYIITRHSDINTKTIIKLRSENINILISCASSMYNNVILYKTQFFSFDPAICMTLRELKKNTIEYKNINIISHVLSTNKYINIIEGPDQKYVSIFFNRLYKECTYNIDIIYNILDVFDKDEYNIIMQTIHTKQKYYAQKKKYTKYILPY